MVFLDIIILTLLILFGVLGALIVMGFILQLLEKKNMGLIARTFGVGGIIATGLGTVVHETGHLIMCWIFGHKVIKVELFRPKKFRYDGVLGKVTHSYNKKNFWHTLGNFFIGAGPIIFGITVIALLLWLLLPDVNRALIGSINTSGDNIASGLNIGGLIKLFFTGIWNFIKALFAPSNFIDFRFWIFMIVSICIAMHMSLSRADLKGCAKGIVAIVIVAVVIAVIFTLLKVKMSVAWIIGYNIYIVAFLTMGILLSLVMFLLLLPAYAIKRRLVRNKVRKQFAESRKLAREKAAEQDADNGIK